VKEGSRKKPHPIKHGGENKHINLHKKQRVWKMRSGSVVKGEGVVYPE